MESIARLRNVAVVGPHHAGKTTLVEAVLAHCGAIPRRGSVRDARRSPIASRKRSGTCQSVCVGFAHTVCGEIEMNLIDTPGFVDFFEETKTVLSCGRRAVVVIDAEPERVAQTAAIVEFLEMRKMPHLFFMNKLDRPGANFDATLAALREAYGPHVVATHVPIGTGERFSGYVDLACAKAFRSENTGGVTEIPFPAELAAVVDSQRTILLEALADFDDALLEELLEGKAPSQDEIDRDLVTTARTTRSSRSWSAAPKKMPACGRWSTPSRGCSPRRLPNRDATSTDVRSRRAPTDPSWRKSARRSCTRSRANCRSCACSPARSRRRLRWSTHPAAARRFACRASCGCSARSRSP